MNSSYLINPTLDPKLNNLKEGSKKLSFYADHDASDEGSERSPGSIVRPSDDELRHKECVDGKSLRANSHTTVSEVGHASDSEHDDRSPESRSFKGRASVTGKSEDDQHGDLDYDEDSITDSPSNHGQELSDLEKKEPTGAPSEQGATHQSSHSKRLKAPEADLDKESDVDSDLSDSEDTATHQRKLRSFMNVNLQDDDESSDLKTKASKDRSTKSYQRLLKYFFKDTCYFQIKSINHENVEISKNMGIWSTPAQNELRLNAAFREHRNVILIFSVQQSGAFQGFARMTSPARPTTKPLPWVLPQRLSRSNLGGVFKVEWLCTKELSFNDTRDLRNPLNEDKPIKVARDGQQVDSKIGRKLCLLFPRDSKTRLLASVSTLKEQTRHRKYAERSRGTYYPDIDLRAPPNKAYHHAHGPLPPQFYPPFTNGYDPISSGPPPLPSHPPSQYDLYSYRPQHAVYSGPRGRPIGRRRGAPEHFRAATNFHEQHPSHLFDPPTGYGHHGRRGMEQGPVYQNGFNPLRSDPMMPPEGFQEEFYANHHNYPPHPATSVPNLLPHHPYNDYWAHIDENPTGYSAGNMRYHPYQRGGGVRR